MSWESQGIALLSASIFRPLALAASAWLILRVFRVRHPASRHAVWTAVLIGIFVLPFMSELMPHWSVPVLPTKPERRVQHVAHEVVWETHDFAALPIPPTGQTATEFERPPAEAPGPAKLPKMGTLAVWFYLAGVFAMFAYRVAGWVLLRRVVSRSKRLRGPWLRESADVLSPVAIGVLRPVVLLPESWRGWSADTRSAVLAHEFAHLRRKDTFVAALSRLLKCMLWFHPLAWWISRELSELAELACDAAALESVRDPARYSRVLLQFARGVNGAGSRIALPGLAMGLAVADPSGLSNRIDQVFELSTGTMRRLRRPAAVLALLGLPVMCLAAMVGLGESGATLSRIQLSSLIPPRMPSAPMLSQIQLNPLVERHVLAAPQTSAAKPAPRADRNALRPRFETASVEISGPPVSGELCWGGCGGPLSPYPESRNQITYRHFTLRKFLLRAYDVKDWQIVGSSSIDTDVYDVDATAAPGTTQEVFQVMLRNLLVERFQLELHLGSGDVFSGYDLVVANGGPKLKESQGPDASVPVRPLPPLDPANSCVPPGGSSCQSTRAMLPFPQAVTSTADLSRVLSDFLGVPVADATGLTKRYDIDLTQFIPDAFFKFGGSIDFSGSFPYPKRRPQQPPFSAEVRRGLEQLGLTLEEKKTPTDMLVIDHVGFVPAAK